MKIKPVFDKAAQSYDQARRQLVPCFDDLGRPENLWVIMGLGVASAPSLSTRFAGPPLRFGPSGDKLSASAWRQLHRKGGPFRWLAPRKESLWGVDVHPAWSLQGWELQDNQSKQGFRAGCSSRLS